jgi:hypothetical protein
MRPTYEQMSDVVDPLYEAELLNKQSARPGTFKAMILTERWLRWRGRIVSMFKAHGWTEAEWEAECSRRIGETIK